MPLNKALAELVFGDRALVSVLFRPHRHPQLCSMETSVLKMPGCSPFTVRVAFSSHKGHVEFCNPGKSAAEPPGAGSVPCKAGQAGSSVLPSLTLGKHSPFAPG